MYTTILTTVAALLSVAGASPLVERQSHPDQIVLGTRSIIDGSQFVAWLPATTSLQSACDSNVVIQNNHFGQFDRPICGSPFSIGNLVNVTLECATHPVTPTTRDVVALRNAKGKKLENCVPAHGDAYRCSNYVAINQDFICTWEA